MRQYPVARFVSVVAAFAVGSLTPVFAADPGSAIKSHHRPYPAFGSVERLDPALDEVLAPGAAMESLAVGFNWSEGPVWREKTGDVVFSDVPENIAYRWTEGAGVSVLLHPSGLTGEPNGAREPGSNGLLLDGQGRLLLAQHGNRCIARLNDDGRTFTTLVGKFEGKRFNSPNDLCRDRRGNIYFTDPPYGLGGTAVREIEFHGVYRLAPDGTVSLLTRELERPNGVDLSPDEKTLYVANSDGKRPIIMAFDLRDDGTVGAGRTFFDSTRLRGEKRPGSMDGMSVDARGNLWATGPGGVLIIDPKGKHLGTLLTGRPTGNCCFGGSGGKTLFVTSDDVLCRIETKVAGR